MAEGGSTKPEGGAAVVGMAEERCPICLDDFQDKAFITSCFHSYCFNCVVKAAEVSGNRCPMCKTRFTKVIHNIQANDVYDTYQLPPPSDAHSSTSRAQALRDIDEAIRNFRGYRTTVHPIRTTRSTTTSSHPSSTNSRHSSSSRWSHDTEGSAGRGGGGRVVVHISLPGHTAGHTYVSSARERDRGGRRRGGREFGRSVRRSGRCAPVSYRQAVYSAGVRALPLDESSRGHGRRVNDISAAFYKRNPARTHRLGPWLSREFEALLGEEQVEFMMQLILSLIDKVDLESEYFASHLEPFLNERTSHFMHELVSYAKSPYDMIAYDSKVRYNWPTGYQPAVVGVASSSRSTESSGAAGEGSSESASGPSSSSASSSGFRQRLFQEVLEEPPDVDESCFIVSPDHTPSDSPIIIHGSDSESDLEDVAHETAGTREDRGDGEEALIGARAPENDAILRGVTPNSGTSQSVGDGLCTGLTTARATTTTTGEGQSATGMLPSGGVGSASTSLDPVGSSSDILQRVKDEPSTSVRHSIADPSGNLGESTKHFHSEVHSSSDEESLSLAVQRTDHVSGKGKSKMGSDAPSVKKRLLDDDAKKSSHKKKHHHHHHHRHKSRKHHRKGSSHRETGEGESRKARKRLSESNSLSPPLEYECNRDRSKGRSSSPRAERKRKEHKRKHRDKEREHSKSHISRSISLSPQPVKSKRRHLEAGPERDSCKDHHRSMDQATSPLPELETKYRTKQLKRKLYSDRDEFTPKPKTVHSTSNAKVGRSSDESNRQLLLEEARVGRSSEESNRQLLLEEARALDEEILTNKKEILKSALKKERIELLHRNMHGSALKGKEEGEGAGLGERGVVGGRDCTNEMLRDELDQLNEEIRSSKKQLLSVVKRMEEEEQMDSD